MLITECFTGMFRKIRYVKGSVKSINDIFVPSEEQIELKNLEP